MKKASNIEKLSGSLATSGGATIIAALSGGPIAAALLPLLTSTLANGRHKKRMEAALKDLEEQFKKMGDQLNHITDAQYKFINESIITMLHSPDDAKIEFLKEGIKKSAASDRISLHEAGLISRILRDITVEELTFLIECNGQKIVFHTNPVDGCLNISKLTSDGERATGLIALGLLTKGQYEGVLADDGEYLFTPISKKIIDLII